MSEDKSLKNDYSPQQTRQFEKPAGVFIKKTPAPVSAVCKCDGKSACGHEPHGLIGLCEGCEKAAERDGSL